MQVNIIKKCEWRIPQQFVHTWLAALAREISRHSQHQIAGRELTLVFVEAKEIKELNRRYRKKNKPTDILSFAAGREDFSEPTLGDLVLCGDILMAQAREHGLTPKQELGYLLIHGVLHLLGFKHEKGGPEAKKMFALQDLLFAKMDKHFF